MSHRVLVIGASGLVGSALLRAWNAAGAIVLGTSRSGGRGLAALDLTSPPSVAKALSEFRPDWVAVPAANPHVDYCELHPEETRRLNQDATIAALRAAAAAGARTMFFSSDYVFDGAKSRYTEEDAPGPLNEYGRQKLAVERAAPGIDPKGLVLRSSGIYGWQSEPKNFVLQVRANLSAGRPMRLSADLSYNPTLSDDLAAAAVALAASGASGLFHAAGAESVTRYDFAVMAARAFGLDPAGLVPVPSAEFTAPARRPKSSALDCAKLARATGLVPSGPAEGLRRMLASAP